MKVDIQMTLKEPEKASAMIPPRTGNKRVQPFTTFEILAALMLLMLNFSIRYTIRFADHPLLESCRPIIVPVTEKSPPIQEIKFEERERETAQISVNYTI